MSLGYQKLATDVSDVLAAITTFSVSEVAEVYEFLAAGEYGVAFETLCSIIKEEEKFVSPAVRRKIRELGERMKIDPEWWREIAEGKLPKDQDK